MTNFKRSGGRSSNRAPLPRNGIKKGAQPKKSPKRSASLVTKEVDQLALPAIDETFLRLFFMRGVTPDKWADRWRAVTTRIPLELVPVAQNFFDLPETMSLFDTQAIPPHASSATSSKDTTAAEGAVDASAKVAIVRLTEGDSPVSAELHGVYLYTEKLALIVTKDHELASFKTVGLDEASLVPLIDYPTYNSSWPTPLFWQDASHRPDSIAQALQLVAAGLGATIVPLPLARSLSNKKEHKIIELNAKLPATDVYAVWPVSLDSTRVQELIGVLRGRRANSSR